MVLVPDTNTKMGFQLSMLESFYTGRVLFQYKRTLACLVSIISYEGFVEVFGMPGLNLKLLGYINAFYMRLQLNDFGYLLTLVLHALGRISPLIL